MMRESNETIGDENPRHKRLDAFIVRYFPLVIVFCLILVAAFSVVNSISEIHEILYNICIGFVSGFVILGIICLFFIDKPVVKYRYFVPVLILGPIIFSGIMFYRHGVDFSPTAFISQFYLFFKGGEVNFGTLLMGCYVIELTIITVAAAVSSVISAYFRKYFSKILIGPIKNNPNKLVIKVSNWLFDIPEVLDIHDVVLEPEADDEKFNVRVFYEMMSGIIVSGLAICSFIFLSPYFVNEMPIEVMLMVSVFLSLFIAALIVPWHIVRCIGVKAKSDAPRDVYLWNGMRRRLTTSAVVVMFFLLLFMMLAYLKMDLAKVFIIYASYLAFIVVISALYSFMYVNSFYRRFKNGMIESFDREKQAMEEKIIRESKKPM